MPSPIDPILRLPLVKNAVAKPVAVQGSDICGIAGSNDNGRRKEWEEIAGGPQPNQNVRQNSRPLIVRMSALL